MSPRSRSRAPRSTNGGDVSPPSAAPMPGTTGRYLVLMRPDIGGDVEKVLSRDAGMRVASSTDFTDGAVHADVLADSEAVYFEQINVAVVNAQPDQVQAMGVAAADESDILAIEPERIVYALEAGEPIRLPYLPGDPEQPANPPRPIVPRPNDMLV
ncbi:MAG TPA: hypothetical protein VFT99_19695, partial [Roseiflexaceae bacterium]|nr:hypothetical protein [Roseiflexaceae bacterium]